MDPKGLYQLVYASASRELLGEEELEEILDVARRNNEKLGITGMLLYAEGAFLQVLEGPHDEVRALYERIGRDRRHSGIIPLIQGPLSERAFAAWSMGFRRIDQARLTEIPGFSGFLEKGSTPPVEWIGRSRVHRLLDTFRQKN